MSLYRKAVKANEKFSFKKLVLLIESNGAAIREIKP
jgi:hypothetical protein